jgi:hypothetical protein
MSDRSSFESSSDFSLKKCLRIKTKHQGKTYIAKAGNTDDGFLGFYYYMNSAIIHERHPSCYLLNSEAII